MQRKTRVLLILLPVAILLVGLSVFLSHRHTTTSSTGQTTTNAHSVKLDDAAAALPDIAGFDIESIQEALYQKISTTATGATGTYHATVRTGTVTQTSYTYAVDNSSIPYYRFMVDVPAIRQSFQVTFAGGVHYPVSIVHVLCPPADQLIYPKFECTDPEQ